MNLIRASVVVFASLSGSLLPAQVPTVSMRAASVLSAQAQLGPVPIVQTLPVGPLPATGSVFAAEVSGGLLAVTETSWIAGANATLAWCHLEQRMEVNGAGTCLSGPNELVFAVTSVVQRSVSLVIRTTKSATPGVPSTTAEIDIGNDGTIEITGALTTGGIGLSAAIGPQPFEVRVRFAGGFTAVAGLTRASDVVQLEVMPENQLLVLPAVPGCISNLATLRQAWEQSGVVLQHETSSPFPPLVIAVLGLAPQPVQLPHPFALLPCLLMPSPDLVLVMPPAGLELGLPPAVRPVNIWAQCVLLDASGISTSNGFVVGAY